MLKEQYNFKDFIPLITLFGLVLAIATSWNTLSSGDTMRWMELFMGSFFIIFGALKAYNLREFASAYSMYDIVAAKYAWYGYTYPFVELVLGALYIFALYPLATNTATLVVMLVSAWGVYRKLASGEKIMCACLGAVFKVPMTWVTLGEDVLMAVMAGYMLVVLL